MKSTYEAEGNNEMIKYGGGRNDKTTRRYIEGRAESLHNSVVRARRMRKGGEELLMR